MRNVRRVNVGDGLCGKRRGMGQYTKRLGMGQFGR